jgi:hypothetical protein
MGTLPPLLLLLLLGLLELGVWVVGLGLAVGLLAVGLLAVALLAALLAGVIVIVELFVELLASAGLLWARGLTALGAVMGEVGFFVVMVVLLLVGPWDGTAKLTAGSADLGVAAL